VAVAGVQGAFETVMVRVTVLPASPAAELYVGVKVVAFVNDPAPFSVHKMVPLEELAPLTVDAPNTQIFWLPPAEAVGWALTEITTSSVDGVQGAFEIVHLRVAVPPMTRPVTPEVGDEGVVTIAVPDTTDQAPVPTEGVFAASVVVVVLHKDRSDPAFAVVGSALTDITTSSVDAVQGAFDMVHLKVADEPITKPVTPDVGDDGVVIVAVPETTDQAPVPTVGVFPASIVVVTLHKD
jgi:hypothetical protein